MLWSNDRQSYMEQFLVYGRQLTIDELESGNLPEDVKPPTMEQFKQQVCTSDKSGYILYISLFISIVIH